MDTTTWPPSPDSLSAAQSLDASCHGEEKKLLGSILQLISF